MFCICSLSHLFGIVSCTVSNEGRVGRDEYNDIIYIISIIIVCILCVIWKTQKKSIPSLVKKNFDNFFFYVFVLAAVLSGYWRNLVLVISIQRFIGDFHRRNNKQVRGSFEEEETSFTKDSQRSRFKRTNFLKKTCFMNPKQMKPSPA